MGSNSIFFQAPFARLHPIQGHPIRAGISASMYMGINNSNTNDNVPFNKPADVGHENMGWMTGSSARPEPRSEQPFPALSLYCEDAGELIG